MVVHILCMFRSPYSDEERAGIKFLITSHRFELSLPSFSPRCCWWGRGTLQTRGVCQYGKLDYYLGARAAREGRPARYPHLDFCASPQSVCSDLPGDSAVEWITGLFRWIADVQSYASDNDDGSAGWNYIQKLHEFVMGGMADGMFIRSVSSIVTFGCHEAPCPGAEDTLVEMTDAGERWSYFLQALEVLGLPVKALRQE